MNPLIRIYLALLTTLALAPFPARGQAQPPKTSGTNTTQSASIEEFRFDGGGFRDFTRRLGQQFGTNLVDILDVRGNEAYRLQIPKMRRIFSPAISTDWSQPLKLYNQISEEGNGFLGKWIFTPERPSWVDDGNGGTRALPPQTLIFVPPRPAAGEGGAIQVRAFPIRGMAEERLKKLIEIVDQESERIQRDIGSGHLPAGQDFSLAQGRLSVHEGSDLLIAVGGRAYVDLVKTVVDAFMVNYPFMRPGVLPQQR